MSLVGHVIKKKVFIVLKASRPISYCCWCIILGHGMMYSRTISGPTVLLYTAFQTFTVSIPVSILFLAVNDVYDYETDRRNSRKLAGGLEGSVLNPLYHKDVLTAALLSAATILLTATATQHRDNILASALLVFVTWQYSSPPLRMKEIPVIDSLSNGCIGFLIWFFGFSYSGSSIFEVPVTAIMKSFCGVGIHALAAAVDVEADAAGGQITIGTAFGKRPAAICAFVCFFIGSFAVDPIKIYPCFCTAIMLLPCFNITWAHRCFQMIIIAIMMGQIFYVCSRLLWSLKDGSLVSSLKEGSLDCVIEIMFDSQFFPLPPPSSCTTSGLSYMS